MNMQDDKGSPASALSNKMITAKDHASVQTNELEISPKVDGDSFASEDEAYKTTNKVVKNQLKRALYMVL